MLRVSINVIKLKLLVACSSFSQVNLPCRGCLSADLYVVIRMFSEAIEVLRKLLTIKNLRPVQSYSNGNKVFEYQKNWFQFF